MRQRPSHWDRCQSPSEPETHFRIFRLGQWVEGTDAWLGNNGPAVWEGMTSPWDLVEGAPTRVGIDVGLKHDSTAVVAVQRSPDGRLRAACRFRANPDPAACAR